MMQVAMLTPQEIEKIIHHYHPRAATMVRYAGKEITGEQDRFLVGFELFGLWWEIRSGYNFTLLMDGVICETHRIQGLSNIDTVRKDLHHWMIHLKKYLKKGEPMKVKTLARKYFGREEKIKVHKHQTTIIYDNVIVKITDVDCFLINRRTKVMLKEQRIRQPKDLEDFFRVSVGYRESVEKGTL